MTIRCATAFVALAIGAAMASPLPASADALGTISSVSDDPVGTVTSVANDPVGTVTSAANDPVGTVTSAANDPVGTVTSAANDPVGTVTSTAGGALGAASGSAPVSSAANGAGTGGAASALSPVTGSDEGASGGTQASGGTARHARKDTAKSKPGRSYHSRFDRLPRRTEVLLERIELGRHVQQNLRRLRALLASHPRLRGRIERALDAELARLHRAGLTQTERKQVRRLARVRKALRSPTGDPSPLGSSRPAPSGSFVPASSGSAADGATRPSASASAAEAHGVAGAQPDSSGSILGHLPAPSAPDGWPQWMVALLTVLGWLSIFALVAVLVVQFTRLLRAS